MSLRILVYYAKLLNLSLDALIGTIDSEYQDTALDREIMDELAGMDPDRKRKLLQTIQLWKNS